MSRSLALAALCLTVGCQRPQAQMAEPVASTLAAPAKRYIAVRHRVEIETAESELQKAWESISAFCGTIRCEVVSSSITNLTGGSVPSASIAIRVAPDDLKKLLDRVGKSGVLVSQSINSEDKTAAVVDVEAKIRNLTEYRDNLRAMLGRTSGSVRDLIEVRKELTQAQSELDSETTTRKLLAGETEKIYVQINFSVRGSASGRSGAGKVAAAFGESLSVLAESVALLITALFAALPWVALLSLGGWLFLKIKRRRLRGGTKPVE